MYMKEHFLNDDIIIMSRMFIFIIIDEYLNAVISTLFDLLDNFNEI